MKTRIAMTLTAAAAVAAMLAGSAAASAAVPRTRVTRPSDATTAHAVTSLTNRPDSGGDGNWATDSIRRTLDITLTGQSGGVYDFTATVNDSGTFTATLGAFAPNQGAPFTGSKVSGLSIGQVTGSASYAFTATALPDSLLVPASEAGAPVTPQQTTSLWYEQAFAPGTVFGGTGIGDWSWTYLGFPVMQQWTDASSNGDGQQPGDGNITGA